MASSRKNDDRGRESKPSEEGEESAEIQSDGADEVAPVEAEDAATEEVQKSQEQFKIKQLEKRIAEYEIKISEIRDYVKKMEGEIQQIRTRTERETQRLVEKKISDFFLNLLPIVDNFELSLKASDSEKSSFADGVRMIHQQFLEFLSRADLLKISTVGEKFDPQIHEALATQSVDSEDLDGQVIEEVKAGYKLKGQVIRPAQVVVGAFRGH